MFVYQLTYQATENILYSPYMELDGSFLLLIGKVKCISCRNVHQKQENANFRKHA